MYQYAGRSSQLRHALEHHTCGEHNHSWHCHAGQSLSVRLGSKARSLPFTLRGRGLKKSAGSAGLSGRATSLAAAMPGRACVRRALRELKASATGSTMDTDPARAAMRPVAKAITEDVEGAEEVGGANLAVRRR